MSHPPIHRADGLGGDPTGQGAVSDWSERIAALPLDTRALLERHLLEHVARPAAAGTIPRRDPAASTPLSFAQQRLWFLHQMNPEAPAYNMARAFRLRGPLDVEALRGALASLVTRHEALRTVFVAVDGTPHQIVTEAPLNLRVIDIRPVPADEREASLERRVRDESRRPFDLASDAMLRACLVQAADDDHVLLLIVHHIAGDGGSLDVLTRELTALYAAGARGESSPLAPLPIQYGDFAQWQQEWLRGEALHAQLGYWTRQLDGATAVLALPLDHPRPAVQTYGGARQRIALPAGLAADVRAFSHGEGATLFMTLLAAFQVLLFRYTGQEDILVGAPVGGRTRTETEGLIGLFANTLVMRTAVASHLTVRALLAQVREVALAAYAHQDLPFERLVEALHPERTLSHSPLFQVMFTLQGAEPQPLTLRELDVSPLDVDAGTARFDLTLSLRDTGGALDGWLEYDTALFAADSMARLRGHFETVLAAMVADPDRPVSDLPLLTDGERHAVLVECNDTRAPYPRDARVHELVERQVARTPDAVAVVDDRDEMTYAEVNRRADELARRLRRLGVKPNVLVGICVERSADLVVAVLAVLKAEGAYVPLDPAYPRERLRFMIEDAGMPIVLTQERWRGVLPAPGPTLVCLDENAPVSAPVQDGGSRGDAPSSSLAYVIYTSGSTGRPKGVQVSHRAVVNVLCSLARRLEIDERDRLPALTSIAFDIAAVEIFLPLMVGARVHVLPRDVATNGERLARALTGSGVTVVQATPATWRLLVQAGWTGGAHLTALCGGEALPPDLAGALLPRCRRLYNLYGPTETTIWSAIHEVHSADDPVPIGRPLDNTVMYVLDPHRQPVPVGIPGEIYIGGDGVAEGYLGRPELTAERFVPDPLAGGTPRFLFRTGDLARRRPDGALEFLGRADHQVKLRGFRIEPGEVEVVLREHPGVRDCVAVVREFGTDDKRLVAYVVPAETVRATADDWKRFLTERLPDHMIPSAFVSLPALPVTPNGKLDPRSLPPPQVADAGSTPVAADPTTAMEVSLADIWKEMLGVERVGLDDNFFDLGGHSLLAMKVIARVAHEHGVSLSPREFVLRTLGELATVCEEHQRALPRPADVPDRLGARLLRGLRSALRRDSR